MSYVETLGITKIMDRQSWCIIYVVIHYILMVDTKVTTVIVRKPSSIEICRELCQASNSSFNFIKEDLSCQQRSTAEISNKKNEGSRDLFSVKKDKQRDKFYQSDKPGAKIITGDICSVGNPTILQTSQKSKPTPFLRRCKIALSAACRNGNLTTVQNILSRGSEDINCRGVKGVKPVMVAALYGQVQVFDLLVSRGCILTSQDEYQNNLLHKACIGGNIDIVCKLVSYKMYDIDSQASSGWTAVMYAAYCGHKKVVELLVAEDCQMKGVNNKNDTILHVACMGGSKDMVEYILTRHNFDIDIRGYLGRTPVMAAAGKGHQSVVDLLLKKGCSFEIQDHQNDNLLHYACVGGNVDVVRFILSKHILDRESRGHLGRTALLLAAVNGHTDVEELLLAEGCNYRAVDRYGDNLLHAACIGGNVGTVKYILSKGIVDIDSRGNAWRTPVMLAAAFGELEVLDLLIRRGCDLKAVDDQKNNILHVACASGELGVVKYILSKDIIDINSRGHLGRTPVMLAVLRGERHVVDFLLQKDCNLRLVDERKYTLLHIACLCGRENMVKYLLKLKALWYMKSVKDINGKTPLETAWILRKTAIVNLLKRRM